MADPPVQTQGGGEQIGGLLNGIVTQLNQSNQSMGRLIEAIKSVFPVSGTLPVANGGTGQATVTQNGVVYGNGPLALGATAQGAANTVLTGTGAAPAFSATPTIGSLTLSTGPFTAVVGTTAIAPIVFQTGANLTTAAVGALEFDGKAFYATSVASSRQVVDAEQFVAATTVVSLSNSSTAAQAIFASANDTLTLAAATSYFFEAFIYLTHGTTSHTTAFGLGGSATFTSILYSSTIWTSAAVTIATASSNLEVVSATATVLNAASTDASTKIRLRGIIRVNGAGTIIPQITFGTGPTGTCQTETNSYFRVWPVGSNTVAAVGNWG